MFLGKGFLKICCKFTGKQPRRSVISIKLQSTYNFLLYFVITFIIYIFHNLQLIYFYKEIAYAAYHYDKNLIGNGEKGSTVCPCHE